MSSPKKIVGKIKRRKSVSDSDFEHKGSHFKQVLKRKNADNEIMQAKDDIALIDQGLEGSRQVTIEDNSYHINDNDVEEFEQGDENNINGNFANPSIARKQRKVRRKSDSGVDYGSNELSNNDVEFDAKKAEVARNPLFKQKYPEGFDSYLEQNKNSIETDIVVNGRWSNSKMLSGPFSGEFVTSKRYRKATSGNLRKEIKSRIHSGAVSVTLLKVSSKYSKEEDSYRIKMKNNSSDNDRPFEELYVRDNGNGTLSIYNDQGANGIRCWQIEALWACGLENLARSLDPEEQFKLNNSGTKLPLYRKHTIMDNFLHINVTPFTSFDAIRQQHHIKQQVRSLANTSVGAKLIEKCKNNFAGDNFSGNSIEWNYQSRKSGVNDGGKGTISGNFDLHSAYVGILGLNPPVLAMVRKPGYVTLAHELSHWSRSNGSDEQIKQYDDGSELWNTKGDPKNTWDKKEEAVAMLFDKDGLSESHLLNEINLPVRLGHVGSPREILSDFDGDVTAEKLKGAINIDGQDMTDFVKRNLINIDYSEAEIIEIIDLGENKSE